MVVFCLGLSFPSFSQETNQAAEKKKERAERKAKKKNSVATMKPEDFNYGTVESLRLAITDLMATYGKQYPKGRAFLQRLKKIERSGDEAALAALRREALLANPLIDFEKILVVAHTGNINARLPANWQSNSSIGKNKHENQLAVLSLKTGKLKRLTQGGGRNEDPTWAPDGRLIGFSSSRGGIFVANEDGNNQTQVMRAGTTPDWGPRAY